MSDKKEPIFELYHITDLNLKLTSGTEMEILMLIQSMTNFSVGHLKDKNGFQVNAEVIVYNIMENFRALNTSTGEWWIPVWSWDADDYSTYDSNDNMENNRYHISLTSDEHKKHIQESVDKVLPEEKL